MNSDVHRFSPHVVELDHRNPFPGMFVLQQRIGRSIRHRLSGNESVDAPTPDLFAGCGDEFWRQVQLYRDPGGTTLRQTLAAMGGYRMSEICLDAGADSVLALCLRAMCVPGDSVVCSAGTYPTFAYLARAAGCVVVETPYRRTSESAEVALDGLLEDAVRTKAKVIYVANPDNPTGSWKSFTEIERFLSEVPPFCTVLLDEAYIDFCPDLQETSARILQSCIRIRSLSKSHALAGLRVGYAFAQEEMIEQLQKVRIHYAVGGLTQHIANTVVSDHVRAIGLRMTNARQRDELATCLRTRGYSVLPSATNFVSVLVPGEEIAEQTQKRLLQAGIAIHRPDHPAFRNLLRITVCHAALSEEVLTAIGGMKPWKIS